MLHTRVPAVLEEELKRFADNLRVPVSNLVRTILEDAISVADRATGKVEQELRTLTDRVVDERERLRRAVPRPEPLTGVLGFQPLVLNVTTQCARCHRALARGESAFLGISEGPGPRVFVCAACAPTHGPPATGTP